jgi:beta-barrel assembly-enhancing protease
VGVFDMMRGGTRQSGGGGGGAMRWIIALVIAGGALISYMGMRQKNPVTGEVQHVALSVDQEKALGLQAAPQMLQQMGARALDPRSHPDARLVADVGMKLVNSTEAGRSPYAGNFNFYLIEDEQINAFALPGGQVFITTTLYNKLQNESQLAGVLGHEIGHVIHRHSAQQMAKGQLGQRLAAAAAVGSNDGRVAAASQMAAQMLQLKYGRGDETQSDDTGIRYMASAGYDPRGMLEVMKVLKAAAGGSRQPEFLSSHPLPEHRLEDIAQAIRQNFSEQQLAQLTTGQPLHGAAGTPRLAGDRQPAGDGWRTPSSSGGRNPQAPARSPNSERW